MARSVITQLNLNNNKITNLAAGTVSTDAVNLGQLSSYPTGTGTTNYVPKWTGSAVLGNSQITDTGTLVGINLAGGVAGITTSIKGLGTSTSTYALGLLNSSSQYTVRFNDAAAIVLGGAASPPDISSIDGINLSPTPTGSFLMLRTNNIYTGTSNIAHFMFSGWSNQGTSGNTSVLRIKGSISGTGTNTSSSLDINTSYNTNTTGVTADIKINPTFVATPVTYRAISIDSNTTGHGIYQSSSTLKNFFNGPTGFGNSAPTYPIDILASTTSGNLVFSRNTNSAGHVGYVAENNSNNHNVQLLVPGTTSTYAGFSFSTADHGVLISNNMPLSMGTGHAYPINLVTNQTTRVNITSTGDVGIGTTPSTKFHVLHGSAFTNRFEMTSGSTVDLIVQSLATGVYFGTSNAAPFYLMTNSSSKFRMDTSGRVNIGLPTTSSAWQLALTDSVTTGFKISTTSNSSSAGIYFGETDADNSWKAVAIKYGSAHATKPDWFEFNTTTSTSPITLSQGGTSRVYINSTGKVGIGTTSPASTLSVNGGVGIGPAYAGSNTAASGNLIVQGNIGIGTDDPQSQFHTKISSAGINGILLETTSNGAVWMGFKNSGTTVLPQIGINTSAGDSLYFKSPAGNITLDSDGGYTLLELKDNTTSSLFIRAKGTTDTVFTINTNTGAKEVVAGLNDNACKFRTRYLLHNSGGIQNNFTSKSADYTATVEDYAIYVDTTTTNRTITLPASPLVGQTYIIAKSVAVNALTISGNGNVINGLTSIVITGQFSSRTLMYTGVASN